MNPRKWTKMQSPSLYCPYPDHQIRLYSHKLTKNPGRKDSRLGASGKSKLVETVKAVGAPEGHDAAP